MTKRRNRAKPKTTRETRVGGERQGPERQGPERQPTPGAATAAGETPTPPGETRPGETRPGETPEGARLGGEPPTGEASAKDIATTPMAVAAAARKMLLPSLSRIMSVVMLMIGIAVVGVLFYRVMVGFFVPLFLAALLVVLFRPVFLWFLQRTNGRKRLAAGLTTAIILLIVLLPLGMLVSIATTQFTVLLSRMNGSMSVAMDRVRGQMGLHLPHAEHFRELDRIIDSIGMGGNPIMRENGAVVGAMVPSDEQVDFSAKARSLDKAAAIIEYLQADVSGPEAASEAADRAIANTREFASELRQAEKRQLDETSVGRENPLLSLNASEQFEQNAVVTAASIRTWMHLKLGGALQSQLKLLANPGEADFSRLIRGARESLQPRFVRLTSATGSILAQILFGLVILVISVYFFLLDGPVMITTLMRLSPMDDAYEHRLLLEFDRTSRAVVLASVASAVVQGILATIGFWLSGFDQVVLLLFLTSLMSLVPFLGAASVWVPCALWLAVVEQRLLAAALLALWGASVVSSIDNVIKVYVLQGRSQLHPLFALLSVVGGVSVFGPIGILVGPMVVVFLQTLLEILNHELQGEKRPDPAK